MNHPNAIECLNLELRDYSRKDIAKKLHLSEGTVSRHISKIKKSREYQMGAITINEFFEVFKRCEEYWNQSNQDYRELIDEVKKLRIDDDRDGKDGIHLHKSKYEKRMERIELIAKLKERQDKNMERIITLAKQGEVVLALKAARGILEQYSVKKPFILLPKTTIEENTSSSS